ncbi:MAG: energy transducer TonB [Verrucomicrobiota bacterium]
MAQTTTTETVKPVLFEPPPRLHVWLCLGAALAIDLTAVLLAQKREAPPVDLSDIPIAVVEATMQAEEQPTPPPEEVMAPTPPPEPENTPEFHEETTPPPKINRPQKIAPIKAPTVGKVGPMSISSAKALAVYAPRPQYPYEARSHHVMGSGVCVVSVDTGTGQVTDASMAQSIGNPILDNAAVSAFRSWRFKPGTVSKVRIPITFTMSGASY